MLKPIDKQAVRSWYGVLAEPLIAKLTGRTLRATGPRVAVVGNCQSFSIAFAIKLLLPSAVVHHFPVIARSDLPSAVFARTLATYDHVFMHDFPPGLIRGGGSAELRERAPKAIAIPIISFAAFHPDCISVGDDEVHAPIFGPLGVYHSALALFAFRKGLSLDEANALFNHNVFEALGYFDIWNDASAELLAASNQRWGMDLSSELLGWARRGVFMRTINHPKPFVLVDVAKKLLTTVGLPCSDMDWQNYMIDDFVSYPTFPVYPPVGANFGCPGSYTFKLTRARAAREVGDYLLLPQFIAGSYAKYRQYGGERLANPRVDGWLRDKATTDTILSLARENLQAGLLPIR